MAEETPKTTPQLSAETPKTTPQPTATSKIVAQAKEYVGAAVEKAQGLLKPTTPTEETPKTKAAPKTEAAPKAVEKPAVALEATASEIGTHTKAYAEAAEAAAVKQADDIKSKVAEVTSNEPEGEKKEDLKTKLTTATRDAIEATKAGVGKYVKPEDHHPSSTTTTTTNPPTYDEGVTKE